MPPEMSIAGDLSQAGRPFHRHGPATAKFLSPKLVRIRATASVLLEDKRQCGQFCTAKSRMATVRQWV